MFPIGDDNSGRRTFPLVPLLKLNFSGFPEIMEVLAIAAGVLILLGR